MFTPKKLWSLTPRSEKNGSVSGPGSGFNNNPVSPRNGETLAKGKAVAFFQGDGIMDHDSSTERASKLESELFDYQYNMGLLLIEKKDWTFKYEELREALADATDTLKREQTAHSSAMHEVEKREDNLKKALGVERQCVFDLEKAIREMRSDQAEIKFNADSKLAEANALVTSVEEKSLEVEAKLHEADAKLAEVSRRTSEIERKFHELEAQENALRRERSFFSKEREAHDSAISKQREDLREWENKLKKAEERVAESRRLLNQREERANGIDNTLKEKQDDLAELQKKIDIAKSSLKSKEDDISSRLANIALKEKDADGVKKRLEDEEKRLLELEEKLNAREKLEIQKLLDEHQNILAEKQKNFELEIEKKRQLNDEELKNKVFEVGKKEVEIEHMEEKVKKREQAVEKKSEKVREKEMDIESKSKSLKEREKSLKNEVKDLENEREQLLASKEELLQLAATLENLKTDNEKLQLELSEERERLKVTEDERIEHVRLQSELKQEIDKYRSQSEQLLKEADDLKQEKENFEKEWEELDIKRMEIKNEKEDVLEQKRNLERHRQSEEERLNNQKVETEHYVQRELEALKLEKDSFAASMEHEKSTFDERLESEKSKLSRDFEMQKQEFTMLMQKKQEEVEASLSVRVKSFEQEKEAELNSINHLRDVARREKEEMDLENLRIENEKREISVNKQHVEEQHREIKKDIDDLVAVSQKLKDQRERFIKERERFLAFAEKQKNCNICGDTIREFMLSDLHPLAEVENLEAPPLPLAVENYLKESVEGNAEKFDAESSPGLVNLGSPTAGGTISWLRKCTTKIFKFSPGKKLELDNVEASTLSTKQVPDSPKTSPNDVKGPESSFQVVNDSIDVETNDVKGPESSFQVVNDSIDVEIVESDKALSNDQDQPKIPINSKGGQRGGGKRGRRRGGRTTRSGKDVLAGSRTNGDAENSVYTNDESQADSDHVGVPKDSRKRNRVDGSQATVSENQTEGHSDSIVDGDRPKRRQRVVMAEQDIGQKRYNLRQNKRLVGKESNGSLPQVRKGKGKKTDQVPPSEAGGASREEPEAAAPVSRRSEGGDGDELVRSTRAASEFSADSPFKIVRSTYGGHIDRALSDKVNGEREDSGEEFISESRATEEDDDNKNDDNDEADHPGQASIGKKLWTFLTT